ncbi:MAG: RluA family pseudouridine synthase [Phycisphaerales bacterium]|nr:RluA family pseudouridine synthase [Phycisphaerales bacterium]
MYIKPKVDLSDNEQEEVADKEVFERKNYIVDPGQAPMRIDKWLNDKLINITRTRVQNMIDAGLVTVDDKTVKSSYKIKPLDKILVYSFLCPEETKVQPEPIPLNIAYEDNDVIVVNKPANMVVHPGLGNFSGTLLNGIVYYLQQKQIACDEDALPRHGLVHRIDKNTTGLLVIGKNVETVLHLSKQFFNHTITRRYVALVWGDVQQNEGTIISNIGRDQRFRKLFTTYPVDSGIGKYAVTHYKVLERFYYVTLVECKLETGRTHQIRVHLKHFGHTLFNDIEYGGNRILKGTIFPKYRSFVDNCFEMCPRSALHAQVLGFNTPTKNDILIKSELPQDMSTVIEKWRNYIKSVAKG